MSSKKYKYLPNSFTIKFFKEEKNTNLKPFQPLLIIDKKEQKNMNETKNIQIQSNKTNTESENQKNKNPYHSQNHKYINKENKQSNNKELNTKEKMIQNRKILINSYLSNKIKEKKGTIDRNNEENKNKTQCLLEGREIQKIKESEEEELKKQGELITRNTNNSLQAKTKSEINKSKIPINIKNYNNSNNKNGKNSKKNNSFDKNNIKCNSYNDNKKKNTFFNFYNRPLKQKFQTESDKNNNRIINKSKTEKKIGIKNSENLKCKINVKEKEYDGNKSPVKNFKRVIIINSENDIINFSDDNSVKCNSKNINPFKLRQNLSSYKQKRGSPKNLTATSKYRNTTADTQNKDVIYIYINDKIKQKINVDLQKRQKEIEAFFNTKYNSKNKKYSYINAQKNKKCNISSDTNKSNKMAGTDIANDEKIIKVNKIIKSENEKMSNVNEIINCINKNKNNNNSSLLNKQNFHSDNQEIKGIDLFTFKREESKKANIASLSLEEKRIEDLNKLVTFASKIK